ncbi:MAG: aminopeptidase [bacterium]|nr:aminopeptidase [bacterium]
MKRFTFIRILVLSLLVVSCTTRSISDSGYQENRGYYHRYDDNAFYRGELNELAVLGIERQDEISEADIQAALADTNGLALQRGDSIILIQSGAMFPDDPMLTEMQQYFQVTPLSGIPEEQERDRSDSPQDASTSLNKVLRLAGARSGAKALIVYWGILESAQEDQVTKTVSWVPFVGSVIPDEIQNMRIRLKGVVIDVVSGKWVMITPQSLDDRRISARLDREAADQTQVAKLKEQAYIEFVKILQQRFSL